MRGSRHFRRRLNKIEGIQSMIGVPSSGITEAWPKHVSRIEEALSYGNGEYELTDIFDAVRAGQMQMWATDKSVAVTTLVQYPRRRTCLIVLAGGDLDDLRENLPFVEEWAVWHECDAVEVMGRKGWLRALPDYEQCQVHVRKTLPCIPSSEIH